MYELKNTVAQDFKCVPVLSTDVERCFSAYKNMLSDKTKSFPFRCILLCTATIGLLAKNLTKLAFHTNITILIYVDSISRGISQQNEINKFCFCLFNRTSLSRRDK